MSWLATVCFRVQQTGLNLASASLHVCIFVVGYVQCYLCLVRVICELDCMLFDALDTGCKVYSDHSCPLRAVRLESVTPSECGVPVVRT